MEQEIGIILASLALLGIGTYPVLIKRVVAKLGEYTCLVFNYLVFVILLSITAVFTIHLTLPSDLTIALMLLGSLVGAVAVYLYYKALKEGNVSIVVVVASTNVIWTVILSYFVFNEALSMNKYYAIAAIFLGTLLATIEHLSLPKKIDEKFFFKIFGKGAWSKGAGLALLVSFCWAFYNVVMKYSVTEVGPHKAAVYMESVLFILLILPFIGKPAKELVTLPGKEELKWLFPSALLFSFGAIGLYFAMSYAPLSVISPIISAAPAVAVIASAIFLRERQKFRQYLGILIAIAGIIALSL